MLERIYSVTEFNKELKEFIEGNFLFSNFFLKGELSGVTYYKSGHLYFTLKDKDSQIRCAAFNYKYKKIPEDLKEGDLVKIFCDLGVYENRGEIQILARHIEKLDLLGEKFLALEKLKKELEEVGYFSIEHKRKLPRYPQNIGIVTSYTGAALQDMIKTIRKRDDRINIYVYPAKVQGTGAKEEIVEGIEALNKIEEIEFIIVGRGGGSLEDLWCFNEREVAKAIFESEKPVISAVGHETDNMLSDLVADIRAATPTQAIEISIPEKRELNNIFNYQSSIVNKNMNNILLKAKKEMSFRIENYYIKNFLKELEKLSSQIVLKEEVLINRVKSIIGEKETRLNIMIEKIVNQNPIRVLQRGYSITTCNGQGIKKVSQLKKGDIIKTQIIDGIITSIVEELKKDDVNK